LVLTALLIMMPMSAAKADNDVGCGVGTMIWQGNSGVLAGKRTSPWLGSRLDQRVGLSKNWSILLSGGYEHAYDVGYFEGRLGLIRYF
jgi:hypothetical protein